MGLSVRSRAARLPSGVTPCGDCGGGFPTWWRAPDALWWAVVGRNDITLCPGCFAVRARAAGSPVHFEAVEGV